MELSAERAESAVVLHLHGRLTVEAGTGWMQDATRAANRAGVRHVMLDMREVAQLDCTGIGQLLQFRRQAHDQRCTLALLGVEGRQRRMLKAAGLLRVFRVFADREEAFGALGLGARRSPFLTAAAPPPAQGVPGLRLLAWAGLPAGQPETEWTS